MKKNKLSAAFFAILLLCGCASGRSELPPDTPYNHGEYAIMETENGYYTNTNGYRGHMLRYYERDTENQTFLCAKPECLHDGNEGCAATYKNLKCINTLLYDGAIYTLAIEDGDIISYSLYKAALDGTSFTKIGDAFSVSNSAGEEYETMGGIYFIIHKGFAYIPYHLNLGASTFGFAGSGLVKMDIQTGKTETLFSGDNYFSAYPQIIGGIGDYVYYVTGGLRNDDPNKGTYRYNIKTCETDKLGDYSWGITVGENNYYSIGGDGDGTFCIMSLDINSETFDEGWTKITDSVFTDHPMLMLNKDRIIAVTERDNSVTVFDEEGKLLGSGIYDFNEISGYRGDLIKNFNISNDKLYVNIRSYNFSDTEYEEKVYSIPIADIEENKGEWKFEYGVKGPWQIYNEMGWDINVGDQ